MRHSSPSLLQRGTDLFFLRKVVRGNALREGTIKLPEPKSFVNFDKSTVSVYIGGQKIIIRHPIAAPDWLLAGTARRTGDEKDTRLLRGGGAADLCGAEGYLLTINISSNSGVQYLII